MMRSLELTHWLNAAVNEDGNIRCVLIAGGGTLADQVRDLHAEWQFDEALAHELALEAMRMNACVLQALAPLARISSDTDEIAKCGKRDQPTIWSPPRPLSTDAFPASWAATSDTIALYVAQQVAADALFLIKSVDANTLVDSLATVLSRDGLLDDYFPQLLAREWLPTRIVAKNQFADFADAYRHGDKNRAGAAVLGS